MKSESLLTEFNLGKYYFEWHRINCPVTKPITDWHEGNRSTRGIEDRNQQWAATFIIKILNWQSGSRDNLFVYLWNHCQANRCWQRRFRLFSFVKLISTCHTSNYSRLDRWYAFIITTLTCLPVGRFNDSNSSSLGRKSEFLGYDKVEKWRVEEIQKWCAVLRLKV